MLLPISSDFSDLICKLYKLYCVLVYLNLFVDYLDKYRVYWMFKLT